MDPTDLFTAPSKTCTRPWRVCLPNQETDWGASIPPTDKNGLKIYILWKIEYFGLTIHVSEKQSWKRGKLMNEN